MVDFAIFSGSAHINLAKLISKKLGVELGNVSIGRYSDGEIKVEIFDTVRGKDIYLLQPTCAPTNENLLELIFLADAIYRSSAARITAIIPYFGYARQDRRIRSSRVPISAKVVADLLAAVQIRRVVTVDLHSDQIQGFFNIPVDNTYGSYALIEHILSENYSNPMIVSPDVGGVVRARAFAKRLNSDLAIIDKRRPYPNQAEIMNIIGNVQNRDCLLIDDMVDTAGTLIAAARALKNSGANKVIAYCTHPVFSGQAIKKIAKSCIDSFIVTDTIPLHKEATECIKIKQLSIAPMLSEVIYRLNNDISLSSMFE